MNDERPNRDLGSAIGILAAVWLALLAQPWLAQWTEPDVASLICFVVATAIVLIPSLPLGLSISGARLAAAGLLAGVALRWTAGAVLPGAPVHTETVLLVLVARGVLAPVFEEVLYRERLMIPLQQRLGNPAAVLITSALFALPHASPLYVAQVFILGIGLGVARVLGNSLALCLGLHAGWNLAPFR